MRGMGLALRRSSSTANARPPGFSIDQQISPDLVSASSSARAHRRDRHARHRRHHQHHPAQPLRRQRDTELRPRWAWSAAGLATALALAATGARSAKGPRLQPQHQRRHEPRAHRRRAPHDSTDRQRRGARPGPARRDLAIGAGGNINASSRACSGGSAPAEQFGLQPFLMLGSRAAISRHAGGGGAASRALCHAAPARARPRTASRGLNLQLTRRIGPGTRIGCAAALGTSAPMRARRASSRPTPRRCSTCATTQHPRPLLVARGQAAARGLGQRPQPGRRLGDGDAHRTGRRHLARRTACCRKAPPASTCWRARGAAPSTCRDEMGSGARLVGLCRCASDDPARPATAKSDPGWTTAASVVSPLAHLVWRFGAKARPAAPVDSRRATAPDAAQPDHGAGLNTLYPVPGGSVASSPDRAGNPQLKPRSRHGIDLALGATSATAASSR